MSNIKNRMCSDLMLEMAEVENLLGNEHRVYRLIKIPKKGGTGTRLIHSPSPKAKLVQLWITKVLLKSLPVSGFAYAYVEGRNIKMNADAHTQNKFSLKFDLKDFFSTIRFKFLKSIIEKEVPHIEDKEEMLEIIESFCFLKDGTLPQGFCSSPVISNIVMTPVDHYLNKQFMKLSKGIVFTRYADDLTISFSIHDHKVEIEKIVNDLFSGKNPFRLNTAKTKFGKRDSGSMFVNGIKICHDGRLTIHRDYKDRVRGMFHAYSRGLLEDEEKRSLLGHVYYIRSVDSLHYNKIFRKYFQEIKHLRLELA